MQSTVRREAQVLRTACTKAVKQQSKATVLETLGFCEGHHSDFPSTPLDIPFLSVWLISLLPPNFQKDCSSTWVMPFPLHTLVLYKLIHYPWLTLAFTSSSSTSKSTFPACATRLKSRLVHPKSYSFSPLSGFTGISSLISVQSGIIHPPYLLLCLVLPVNDITHLLQSETWESYPYSPHPTHQQVLWVSSVL